MEAVVSPSVPLQATGMRYVRRTLHAFPQLSFGVRLLVAFGLTLAVVGAFATVLVNRELTRTQLSSLSRDQAADVENFEVVTRSASSQAKGVARIDFLLDAIGRRPGVERALLIDRSRIVVAARTKDDARIGAVESDVTIARVLDGGRAVVGRGSKASADNGDFELVAPVNLPWGQFAFQIIYGHAAFDAQLAGIRRILLALGLVLLVGGGLIFYVAGGRRLMEDHRSALQRATRDGLTNLQNLRAFEGDLENAVASVARHRTALTIAVFDIDDFKFLNDRYGHPHGDTLLVRVAELLHQGRAEDRAYRVGGDEFAVILPHTDPDGGRVLAERLVRQLRDVGVNVSIGLASTRPGHHADGLRAEADAALYEVKRRGGGLVTHYEDIRDEVAITDASKKRAVRRLLDEKSLSTVYQPIWDLEDGRLVGIEALSRPDVAYGLDGPAEAVDVAEQLGLVHGLDVLFATSALDSAPTLPEGAKLFLNLCPQTLDIDAYGDDWLIDAVERNGLAPSDVVVEITERFGGRIASVIKSLHRLREQGFGLALDDVGTGNSGLEILRKVSPDFVKLDRSIVAAAEADSTARAVMLAIASFAHQTDAFVIAEGIEDDATLDFLRRIDSSELWSGTVIQGGQGFRLGRPEPGDEIECTALEALAAA
jgi:diguanylate cyclase (GGDEF)-like protein